MSCIIALTLAATLAVREPVRTVTLRRETILYVREPLPHEFGGADVPAADRRPGARSYVMLPSQAILFVRETPEEIWFRLPCRDEGVGRPPT